jgi:putative transposase
MPRLPRLFAQEFPSHITLRGNDRQNIFHCDGDRLRFLSCLRDAAERNGLAVHAYVLMTNHVHLLATGQNGASTPKTIQSVGRRYVAYFNGRYQRTGTLWEGRYRSTLVEAENYVLACHRYIDLNPVRAGLAQDPSDYPWSSHRFYALGVPDGLVTPHPVVLGLACTSERMQAAYASMFDRPLEVEILDRIRSCSNKGWALGSPEFCRLVEARAQRRAGPLQVGWKKGRKRGPRAPNNMGV